jgi:hypothetical protein
MVPYLDVGVEKRELYQYDVESINDLYLSQTSDTTFITSALSVGTQPAKPESEDNQDFVQGIIELQANGDCKHYIDGELVKVHKKKSPSSRARANRISFLDYLLNRIYYGFESVDILCC